ncbi:hypothetical protein CSHISOI_06742 [Colletotrichum shisoi]|uniref:Uncharacterized protein n=1 Tax=Colletotrichum shisoi TaxID=2078593 RepID=A0A5Q4BPV2_9PEZI|nr:hypothetical protein CSHISOI_06742 [Colletotrichum shisoi]
MAGGTNGSSTGPTWSRTSRSVSILHASTHSTHSEPLPTQ